MLETNCFAIILTVHCLSTYGCLGRIIVCLQLDCWNWSASTAKGLTIGRMAAEYHRIDDFLSCKVSTYFKNYVYFSNSYCVEVHSSLVLLIRLRIFVRSVNLKEQLFEFHLTLCTGGGWCSADFEMCEVSNCI